MLRDGGARSGREIRPKPLSVRIGQAQVNALGFDEAVARICELAAGDRVSQLVVTPNIQHIAELERNETFRRAYQSATLCVPDGWPLVVAARLSGVACRERVTGSDLLPAVCAAAAGKGLRVAFVGGRPGAAAACAARLTDRWPGLEVAFVHEAPMGFEDDPVVLSELLDGLAAARPNILFLGFGAPKQELFAYRHRPAANVVLGVGAALDFHAGFVPRAPELVQRIGMEWLHRIVCEPRRLARRYAVAAPLFMWITAKGLARTRFGPRDLGVPGA